MSCKIIRTQQRWLKSSSTVSHECNMLKCTTIGEPWYILGIMGLNHKFKPPILFLFETKSNERRIKSSQRQLRFYDSLSCDKEGKSGWIALFWTDQIRTTELSKTRHHIDVVVKEENKITWKFIGFYEHPNPSQRYHSWELLKRIKSLSQLPWLVGGYLNEILCNSEKRRHGKNPRAMLEF